MSYPFPFQDFILSHLIVANVRNPIWRSSKHKVKEQNQLSKKTCNFYAKEVSR